MGDILFTNEPRNDVYLLQCIAFGLSFFLSIILLIKTKKKGFAWFALAMFSALQTAGGSIILYVNHEKLENVNPGIELMIVGSVFLGVSLTPLLLTAIQLLTFGNTDIRSPFIQLYHLIIGRFLVIASAVLAAVGATHQFSAYESHTTTTLGIKLLQTSSVVYITSFVYILVLTLICHRVLDSRFNRAFVAYIYALYASTPFFLIRLIYNIISAFTYSSDIFAPTKFSLFSGEWQIYLGMGLIMEIAIVIIFLVVGYVMNFRKTPVKFNPSGHSYPQFTQVKEDGYHNF